MIENTNTKQFYPGPILNNTLEITDFLFNDAEQIKVKHSKLNEEGILIDVDLNYPTDYEVTKVLPSDINAAEAALTASTGQVTLKNVNVLAGEKLTVYRVSQIIQDVDYPRTGAFPAASHEGALDYLTMQNQEQQEQINRSLKIPNSVETFDAQMPTPLPARALKINADGTGFEMSEFDPDVALITTEEFKNQAQQAAIEALASQNVAAEQANIATEQATITTEQANIATQQANIATQQATIATNKTSEVVASGNMALTNIDTAKNNAITSITNQETTLKTSLIDEGATQIGLIQNEGATQVTNVQSTGFYMRDDKLYFINSQGEETKFKQESGLEVCDIGMALYVDETKGLRRYLNGQIVDINANTQSFLNRLKQITTLYPSLLCTEEEWQTAKTMSVFGQVGKFVFNYSGDEIVSVRIPAIVNVQGLFDLQNLGMTVGQALPSHTHTRGTMNITGTLNIPLWTNRGTSGAFYEKSSGGVFDYGSNSGGYTAGFNANRAWTGNTSAPNYAQTVNDGAVQQEAIQYPYFIQVATGQETENNITNEIELNNPSFFGDSKYVPTAVNNLSWLKSEGQNNPKGTYPSFYDWILENVNKGEKGFKLSTASDITDYDFVINPTDETFRLPLLNGSENLVGNKPENILSKVTGSPTILVAPKNGTYLAHIDVTNVGGWALLYNDTAYFGGAFDRNPYVGSFSTVEQRARRGDQVRLEYDGVTISYFRFIPDVGNGSLYYYVGETVQNANLVDVGRIGEILPTKLDASKVKAYIVETYRNDYSWYRIYSDGWCEQGGLKISSSGYGVITVYLLKPFINTAYWVHASRTGLETIWFTGSSAVIQNGVTDLTGVIETRLSDRFTMQALGYHLWYACGYIR